MKPNYFNFELSVVFICICTFFDARFDGMKLASAGFPFPLPLEIYNPVNDWVVVNIIYSWLRLFLSYLLLLSLLIYSLFIINSDEDMNLTYFNIFYLHLVFCWKEYRIYIYGLVLSDLLYQYYRLNRNLGVCVYITHNLLSQL